MFTTIEGEWDEVLAVVKRATEAVGEYGCRVSLVIKADIRPGFSGELTGKVERLENAIAGGRLRRTGRLTGPDRVAAPDRALRRALAAATLGPCLSISRTPGWVAVEELPLRRSGSPDGSLKRAVQRPRGGMPPIEVAPNAGKLLKLLVQISGARRVLEIGTLAGFSTIWMAQGLPDDGRLVTCEYLALHAALRARTLTPRASGHKVDIRVGAALDTPA